jgi:rfaE bifunctional protein nucleotidyltransferase chain/domain/rfaE bifunctional protein kinase chain/domain
VNPRGPFVIVGDVLLDRDIDGEVRRISPDAPVPVLDEESATDRPGGAGLAALLAAGDDHPVVLITALADDDAGARLRDLLGAAGVTVYALPLRGATAEKIRLRAAGQMLLRLDRGGTHPRQPGPAPDAALAALRDAAVILVSDYGRGVARHPDLRAALEEARAPVVWDPHPRGPEPTPGTRLATPNEAEVGVFTGAVTGAGSASTSGATPLMAATRGGHQLRQRWRVGAVAVTLGARGAVLCHTGPTPLVVSAPAADGDTCGAGDKFAAAAALALGRGALVSEAVQSAVAQAAAYVAAGGVAVALAGRPGGRPAAPAGRGDGGVAAGADPVRSAAGPVPVDRAPRRPGVSGEAPPVTGRRTAGRVVAEVRARGGTVVATGGCFDLLHAGHVTTLQAARQLGDCLIVCLNSDAGVAALKGPDRPLTAQSDRARLLTALGCVDAVVLFDEPTPEAVLSWLRPDIWVKGGDYADGGPELPEAALVAAWGGQTVIVPYLDGRSTTNMIAAAQAVARQAEGAA